MFSFQQKQVFEPPHRRIEDREDHQRNLETAFEDMYMAQTGRFILIPTKNKMPLWFRNCLIHIRKK